MILAAQSEAFKQENILAERLHGLDQQMERKRDESLYFIIRIWVLLVGSVMDEAHASSKEWNSSDDQLRLRWMIYLVVLADVAERVRDAIGFEYCLASSSGWTKSPVLWAEIRESSLTGLELRLPEELNSVHDTFHVSNLTKCLADANLHVPLDDIKVDKTLRFVEEPVEIMDREIKKLKRRKIAHVKVRWNSKRDPNDKEWKWCIAALATSMSLDENCVKAVMGNVSMLLRDRNWKLRFEHSGLDVVDGLDGTERGYQRLYVPLLGELGAEADEPMVGPAVDEITEPIVEMEEQVIAPVIDMEEDIAMLFGDSNFSDDDSEGFEDEKEVWEVGGPSTAAAEGQSFTLPAPGFPVPPSMIEALSTRMGNLEYGHGQLVKKVI
ncbi:hypothetical protein Tco_1439720 [Tanacetum coccineum]